MACNASIYYATAAWTSMNVSGNALLSLIQERVSSPHTAIPYTSSSATDVWDALTYLDADPDRDGYVVEIYSDRSTPEDNNVDANGWNREHVFPKSYGVGYSGADYTDLHSLRAASWRVNSARGNKPFGECSPLTDSTCSSPAHADAANDTAANPSLFQPPQAVRGDLARSLFYMAARYDGSDSNTEDLVLSACPETLAFAMGNLTLLRQWHIEDPVDDRELWRTDAVCRHYQGNRNPFIDFPELVEMVWGNYSDYVCHTEYSDQNPSPSPTEAPSLSPTTVDELNTQSCLLLTGIVDGDTAGGLPKAIELVVSCDGGIEDVSDYGIGNANNGLGSDGEEYNFPTSALSTTWQRNDFIYVAYESTTYTGSFESFFGFAPNFTSSVANINGDDAIELYFRGSVVDIYGNVSQSSNDIAWEYTDGWAYRKNGTNVSTPSSKWLSEDWHVNKNYLSGFSTNSEAGVYKFPAKSYVVSESPTLVPTSQPTSLPIPQPTPLLILLPTSQPISLPIPQPTSLPIPQPTSLPFPQPTSLPIPQPTYLPIPQPTSLPFPQPTYLPIPQPTLHPTSIPTMQPTTTPTMQPTSTDTFTVAVSFDLTSTSIPSVSDEANLKSAIAEGLNVSALSIKSFDLTYVSSSSSRRHLLSSYIWTAYFDLTLSLASTESSSSSEYVSYVTTTIASASFTSSVVSSVSATVDTSSVVSTLTTRSPTFQPSIGQHGDDDTDDDLLLSSASMKEIGILIGIILICMVGCGGFLCFQMKQHLSDDETNNHGLDRAKSVELTEFDSMYPTSINDSDESPPPPAMSFERLSSFSNLPESTTKNSKSNMRLNAVAQRSTTKTGKVVVQPDRQVKRAPSSSQDLVVNNTKVEEKPADTTPKSSLVEPANTPANDKHANQRNVYSLI